MGEPTSLLVLALLAHETPRRGIHVFISAVRASSIRTVIRAVVIVHGGIVVVARGLTSTRGALRPRRSRCTLCTPSSASIRTGTRTRSIGVAAALLARLRTFLRRRPVAVTVAAVARTNRARVVVVAAVSVASVAAVREVGRRDRVRLCRGVVVVGEGNVVSFVSRHVHAC